MRFQIQTRISSTATGGHVPLHLTAYLRRVVYVMPNVAAAVRGRAEELMWLVKGAETALLRGKYCDQS